MVDDKDDMNEHWIKLVTEEFYERVYKDEWLKLVFQSIPKEFITSQQIDFMVGAFGGEQRFSGRSPKDAHPHIFVTDEMWMRREELLREAMVAVNCPAEICEKWLKIDNAFKKFIIMKSPMDCQKRFGGDEIIIVPNPAKKAA